MSRKEFVSQIASPLEEAIFVQGYWISGIVFATCNHKTNCAMDFLVAAGIGLLIFGLLSKIKDLFGGWLDGIEYKILQRKRIREEIVYRQKKRESEWESVTVSQRKLLDALDKMYLRRGTPDYVWYITEESKIMSLE